MITPRERMALIDQLGAFLHALEGKCVSIVESITWDRMRGHDRHCTVQSRFKMLVERVSWQMSGGHFYLFGLNGMQYGITTGQLQRLVIEGGNVEIVEQFETKTERVTRIAVEPYNASLDTHALRGSA